MCGPKDPPKVANIIPEPPPAPEEAPKPVKVAPDKPAEKKRYGRQSLRIDLAAGAPKSGATI